MPIGKNYWKEYDKRKADLKKNSALSPTTEEGRKHFSSLNEAYFGLPMGLVRLISGNSFGDFVGKDIKGEADLGRTLGYGASTLPIGMGLQGIGRAGQIASKLINPTTVKGTMGAGAGQNVITSALTELDASIEQMISDVASGAMIPLAMIGSLKAGKAALEKVKQMVGNITPESQIGRMLANVQQKIDGLSEMVYGQPETRTNSFMEMSQDYRDPINQPPDMVPPQDITPDQSQILAKELPMGDIDRAQTTSRGDFLNQNRGPGFQKTPIEQKNQMYLNDPKVTPTLQDYIALNRQSGKTTGQLTQEYYQLYPATRNELYVGGRLSEKTPKGQAIRKAGLLEEQDMQRKEFTQEAGATQSRIQQQNPHQTMRQAIDEEISTGNIPSSSPSMLSQRNPEGFRLRSRTQSLQSGLQDRISENVPTFKNMKAARVEVNRIRRKRDKGKDLSGREESILDDYGPMVDDAKSLRALLQKRKRVELSPQENAKIEELSQNVKLANESFPDKSQTIEGDYEFNNLVRGEKAEDISGIEDVAGLNKFQDSSGYPTERFDISPPEGSMRTEYGDKVFREVETPVARGISYVNLNRHLRDIEDIVPDFKFNLSSGRAGADDYNYKATERNRSSAETIGREQDLPEGVNIDDLEASELQLGDRDTGINLSDYNIGGKKEKEEVGINVWDRLSQQGNIENLPKSETVKEEVPVDVVDKLIGNIRNYFHNKKITGRDKYEHPLWEFHELLVNKYDDVIPGYKQLRGYRSVRATMPKDEEIDKISTELVDSFMQDSNTQIPGEFKAKIRSFTNSVSFLRSGAKQHQVKTLQNETKAMKDEVRTQIENKVLRPILRNHFERFKKITNGNEEEAALMMARDFDIIKKDFDILLGKLNKLKIGTFNSADHIFREFRKTMRFNLGRGQVIKNPEYQEFLEKYKE